LSSKSLAKLPFVIKTSKDYANNFMLIMQKIQSDMHIVNK